MQVCSDPTPMHCSKVQGKLQSHCSVLLCKTGSQDDCATALTHMEICFSYKCAVTQHHSSAVPTVQCCSAKQAQKQAGCHSTYKYGDLLFIQVCSDPAPQQCSKVQGAMQFPLSSAALQNRLNSRHCVTALTHMEICSSCRCAVTQHQCTVARFRANCSPTVQCCSAKQAHRMIVPLHLHIWRFALHAGVQ